MAKRPEDPVGDGPRPGFSPGFHLATKEQADQVTTISTSSAGVLLLQIAKLGSQIPSSDGAIVRALELHAHHLRTVSSITDMTGLKTAFGNLQSILAAPQNQIMLDFALLRSNVELFAGLTGAIRIQEMQITSACESISRLLAKTAYSASFSGLFDAVNRYGQAQMSIAAIADRPEIPALLRGGSLRSSRLYDSYLDGLPARPAERRIAVAERAGNVQAGLIIAESLTAPNVPEVARLQLARNFEESVLEPWQSGPSDVRVELFASLSTLEPDLPDWLKAAWDDVVRDGPKAASKVANCTVECIDRALRAAAPEPEVVEWLGARVSQNGMLSNGRPTRRAKVMFVMRSRSVRDGKLASAQVEALVGLIQEVVNDMQSVKHGDAPSIATMRSWLLAAEAALAQLFLHL